MLVDPSSSAAGSTVTGAIRQASQATGASFNYLLATAQVESGLNPHAGAPTSSARGLFQFIEQTWLGTIKQSGAGLGYGRYADAISKTSSGHYQVNDPTMRAEILKLRNDPTANAVMAGAFTKANADYLAAKLGRQPSEGELYIAHFLGAGGASRLISLAAANPNARAADYFPHAANANPSIFFDRASRAPRSLAQVRDVLVARYDVARTRPNDAVRAAQATAAPTAATTTGAPAAVRAPLELAAFIGAALAPAASASAPAPVAAATASQPVPDTAGMTTAFAAATPPTPTAAQANRIFHGLFQDTDRAAPVAAVVSQLWTTPNALPDTAGDAARPSHHGDLRNLFSDPGEGT
ncbi:MAG TPA: transglycosylase SLT domain-containing protein [Xanthobacteraceae bacterium]|nr:transglycosylase SLT domain-containing protein [Xanthobacteraceae bacterium]